MMRCILVIVKRFIVVMMLLAFSANAFAQKRRIVVAADGSGDFVSIQTAFNSIKPGKTKQTVVIKNGIYREKVTLDSLKQFVTLIGEDKFKTVLVYNDHTGKISPHGDTINTRTSASFFMLADNFIAENITFQNDAGSSAGQAVAIEVDGDKAAFKNCRFIGDQDVLLTNDSASRQYFENCYIEGTTDFIFGSSTAWFEKCHIHSKKNSHVTAAATPADHKYGYVFNDCVLTGDSSLRSVSLGRPWRAYSNVIYMNCYLDRHVMPQGWSPWNQNTNHLTARYSEYNSYGPGASAVGRVLWSHQLSDTEAKTITINVVLGDWKPFK
jgi:pectinesterase